MRFEGVTASRLLTGGFVAAALLCGAWLGLKQTMGVASGLDRVENLTLDWRFLLAGARPAPAGVVIVAIDDQTLSEAEGHNLSRETLARIVRAISDFHPRAVAVDIAFPDSKGAKPDAELADALRSTPSVVASIGIFGEDDLSGKQAPSGVSALSGDLSFVPKPSEVLWPTDAIRDATQTGLANVSTDSSGIPRYVPMIFEISDGVAPSFALAAVSVAVGADPVFGPDRVKLAGRTAKTDLGYYLPIRYYGPAGSFRRYSAAKLLRGDLDAESLRGQVVVVGMTAAGLGDTFATPFDRVAPGVEIFATAISNLLSGDTLARTPSTRRIDAAMAGAPRHGDRAHSYAPGGGRPHHRCSGLRPVGGGCLSGVCQRLLAQRRSSCGDERSAAYGLYRCPVPRRAPSGTKVSRGKGDAGQVSVAASGRPPSP